MYKYYLLRVCGVGLFGLLATSTLLVSTATAAEARDASVRKVQGKVETINDAVAEPGTTNESVTVAQTSNEANGLSESAQNLKASTAE